MSDGIIIIGAGGHAKVIADIVLARGEKLMGFLDDKATESIFGYPILGTLDDINKYRDSFSFILGIGNNSTRKRIAEKNQVRWHTTIHPEAAVGRDVEIGEGTVVMAKAVINPSGKIGKHCIINTAAVIEHDNTLGDFVHISPNSTLCGTVSVGALTHIGAGVTVKNNTRICRDCVIGAGAVVVKNIEDSGIYIGIPAHKKEAKDFE